MKKLLSLCAGVALAAFTTAPVAAQSLPSCSTMTILVPNPPGGFLEIGGRIIANEYMKKNGTTVVLDFRAGGSGTVAIQALKQAAPDGCTLFMGHNATQIINPTITPNLPYDPVKDFAPITTLIYTPTVFVVPASSPAKDLAGLAASASSKPDGLSFGSAGVGTSSHVVGEMFRVATKQNMVHVPYKGTGPMIIDLVEGRLDFSPTSYSAVKGQIDEKLLRPLAIPGATRLAQLPDVPTTAEAGYPSVVLDYWAGLFAPAGTPAPVVDALNAAFRNVIEDPQVAATLTDRGLIAKGNTPAEFKQQIASELTAIRDVVKAADLKP